MSQPGFADAFKRRQPTPYGLTVYLLALWLPMNLVGIGLLVKWGDSGVPVLIPE